MLLVSELPEIPHAKRRGPAVMSVHVSARQLHFEVTLGPAESGLS